MLMSLDEKFMARALQLAKRGRFTTMPNPNVGCAREDYRSFRLDRCLSVAPTGLHFSERPDHSLNHFIQLQENEGCLPETKKPTGK